MALPTRTYLVMLAAAATFCGLSAYADERKPGRVEFQVFRNGEPFGKQSVTVSSEGGQLVARSAADLKVDLGPINVFRYRQTCSETWNGALASLDCATLKDGRTTKVQGLVKDAAFHVSAGKSAKAYPAASIPTAWWSRPPLGSYEMINTETGKPLAVNVTLIGRETITVNGAKVEADHIRVSGTLTVDLWYDDAGHWVDCAFSMSGQNMTYKLLTPSASAPS